MPTITLSAGKVNQMSGLLSSTKKSVQDYVASLKSLEARILTIDGGVCNVEDLIRSIRSSTQVQEAKAEALGALEESVDEFVADVVRIDCAVADIINRGKEDFYEEHPYLRPDCEKNGWERFKDGCKKAWEWCREHWEELLAAIKSAINIIAVVTMFIIAGPGLGMLLLAGLTCLEGVCGLFRSPPYAYDESSPQSMADCLGICYQDYIKTMEYQYGLDERIARLYLELYLRVANDRAMRGKTEREVACEFNRVIASLCKNYGGDHLTFRLTTGNYGSVDAYRMLMDRYGFTEDDAIDFTLALNVQHGFACEEVEAHFGFSRENGILFRPTSGQYEKGEEEGRDRFLKDLVHEAVQYVEFNDDLDFVDLASGSTDRVISYSGDIASKQYDVRDFLSDIDSCNVQKRLKEGSDNFLKVQQDYNKAVMDGTVKPKEEFISNNGGIDEIRNKVNYDIKSFLGAVLADDLLGDKEKRAAGHKPHVDAFINFLLDLPEGGVVDGET